MTPAVDCPCGVWLVQLHLIGQEQRAALHQGVWYPADIRNTPLRQKSIYLVQQFTIIVSSIWYNDGKRVV